MPTSDIAAILFLNSTQIVDDNLYRFRIAAANACRTEYFNKNPVTR